MFTSLGIVNILNKQDKSIGTGFFVSSKGIILTCIHILSNDEYNIGDSIIFKFSNNTTFYTATWIENSDIEDDIAVLKSSISPKVYYKVVSSLGYEGKVQSFGFPNGKYNGIYAKAMVYGSISTPTGILQTQLGNANDITHGFSGAPILDEYENVIGMICSIPKKDENDRLANIAFAIPSSIILNIFNRYFQESDSKFTYKNEINVSSIIGRKSEINYYSKSIKNNSVTIIQGMAGVGKTTLAVYLFETIINVPKLWITIRKDVNNELESVIRDICDYLARIGYMKPVNMLYDLKNSSQPYEIALLNLQKEITEYISKLNISIFIDDAHLINTNPAVTSFFSYLIHTCPNNKFVFITRHLLNFITQIEETISLKGLTEEDCKKVIVKSGLELSDIQIKKIYNKTLGNAKFLEICIFTLLETDNELKDNIINELSSDFNLSNYIITNIMDRFTNIELKILNVIALCRKPVSFDFLMHICSEPFETIYYILDRLVRRNIIEKTNNNLYSMHALLKEQFAKLPATETLVLHQKIAENIETTDYIEISYHYASCGRLNKALRILIDHFDEIISIGLEILMYKQTISYKEIVQSEESSEYYFLLGKLLLGRGQYDLAIDTFTNISDYSSQKLLFNSYIQLCKCYERKGEYSNALRILSVAEHKIKKKDTFEKAVININRGFLLCHQEKISKGIVLCENGLHSLDSQSQIPRNILADGYNDLSWNYIIKGNYYKALTMINRAIELYSNNSRGLSLAKIRLSRIYWQRGQLHDAYESISQAEDLANLIGDPQLQAFALRQKNLILWCLGEFEKSLAGHKDSLKKYSKIKDYWGIAASLENIAAVLYDKNKFKSALQYIDNAINVCNKIEATDFLAYAYLYKSRILSKQGDLSTSAKYACKSITTLIKWKYSDYYLGMALISLALVYFKKKKFKMACIIFLIASAILLRGQAFFQLHISNFYILLCLNKIGRYKKLLNLDSKFNECYNYFKIIGAHKFAMYLETIATNIWRN